MVETMLHFSRSASIIGAPLTIVALLACITPAGAKSAANRIRVNGITANGIAANEIAMNGSALGDLNGVAVEAVVIPEGAIR